MANAPFKFVVSSDDRKLDRNDVKEDRELPVKRNIAESKLKIQ